jgi:protein-tyrosine phosphatase
MTVANRLLPLVGAHNFRDLGGYPAADGRSLRWGQLFRSDALHELTGSDVELLREVGLANVVDLRTLTEVSRTGRGPLEAEPIAWTHLSMTEVEGGESRAAPVGSEEDLAERYLWYLDIGRESAVRVLRLVADSRNLPLVFHCAAGKDRTGVVAALLLDLLGVQRDVIVEDYALTAARMDRIMARLRRDPVVGERIDQLPAHLFTVEAETMARFLDLLQERHGGSHEWALRAGVPAAELAALRDHLLT